MDLKIKGRTWFGNIYHKFETICQDVDDFVAKDTVRYVENQVQTVGESVKKLYSNVVHDFLPPLEDSKQTKADAVSKTQHAGGSHIRSLIGIKEKQRHSSERESSKGQNTVDPGSCDTSEGDNLVEFSPPPSSDSPQVAETDLRWKEDSDATIHHNREMVLEENVVGENYPAARYLSSPREENSSELATYWRQQHLLTVNLESPEDGNLSGPSEISNNGDQSNIILADFCQRDLVEDAGLKTFQKDKMTCNNADLSEEAEVGLSLKEDAETAFDNNNSEIDDEENATVKEHQASEHTSSFEGEDSCKLFCTKEPRPLADDLCPLKDKSSPIRSSTNEDHKSAVLMKHSQEIWVPDTVLRVVPVEQAADNNADPCEEAVTDLSLEQDLCIGFVQHGVGHEANVRKDHPVVDSRSSPNYKSSSDLSLCLREQHLVVEDSSALEDKILVKSLLISTNEENGLTTLDKLSSQTSVNDERLGVFQEEEGVCNRPSCSNETETDFSLDGYCSCVSLDFSVEENDLVEKHAVTEHLDCPEIISSCDLSLYSRMLHVETDGFSFPKAENSSKSSLISRSEDTIPAKFSPDTSVHDARIGAFQKDETACNSFSDVLSSSLSSEPASSCISWEHTSAETGASISAASTEPLDMLEFSLANSTQKTEKVCRDYTDSGVCVSALSTISSASCSGLASSKKAINLIPAFPRTTSSADTSGNNEIDSLVESSGNKPRQFFEGIVDDSDIGIADANMETIELSDKAKLEESCVILDSELLYAASCRPRKFRSYKKLIRDAFTSRKRLIKEYEQLPIWFGDIDADIDLHSEQCVLSRMTSASKTSQANDLSESEWELL